MVRQSGDTATTAKIMSRSCGNRQNEAEDYDWELTAYRRLCCVWFWCVKNFGPVLNDVIDWLAKIISLVSE